MTDEPPLERRHRPAGPTPRVKPVDARGAFDVWLRLVRDERVYAAFVAGRHRECAPGLDLDGDELAILDEFAARPGTRWNVENIRFRATYQVAIRLGLWMPMTVRLLTGGNEDWLRDLVFEYLTFHEWDDLGPYALTECERFAGFVRDRVTLRRLFDPRLAPVLAFETAVVQLLRSTRDVPAGAWPAPARPGDDDELRAMRPRPGPVARVVELSLDVSPWLESSELDGAPLRYAPTTYLVYVPSLQGPHRVQTLTEGARLVFEACAGERTVGEIAAEFEAEHDVPPAAVLGLVRRWVESGALRA